MVKRKHSSEISTLDMSFKCLEACRLRLFLKPIPTHTLDIDRRLETKFHNTQIQEEKMKRKNLKIRDEETNQEKENAKIKFNRKLAAKEPSKTIIKIVNRILKEKNIDKQQVIGMDKHIIDNYVFFRYGLEFSKLFNMAEKNYQISKNMKKVRYLFLQIIKENIDLDFSYTEKIQEYYNNKNQPFMQKTKIDHANTVFAFSAIVLSYFKNKKTNQMVFERKIIDRFAENGQYELKFIGKKNVPLWELFCELHFSIPYYAHIDDRMFNSKKYRYKVKYPETLSEFKELYMNLHKNKEKAEYWFEIFENSLAKFLDIKVSQVTKQKMNVYNRHLTKKYKGENPIMQDYMEYLLDNNLLICSEIISDLNWINFVNQKMRGEYELKSFWYPEKNKENS